MLFEDIKEILTTPELIGVDSLKRTYSEDWRRAVAYAMRASSAYDERMSLLLVFFVFPLIFPGVSVSSVAGESPKNPGSSRS